MENFIFCAMLVQKQDYKDSYAFISELTNLRPMFPFYNTQKAQKPEISDAFRGYKTEILA